MTDSTAAERARRYRKRKHVTDLALMNGWSETDIIAVFVNKRGEHIAIDSNGRRVELVVRTESATPVADQGTNAHTVKPKRFYPPKDMPREMYENNVKLIREGNGTKAQVSKELSDRTDKGNRQFLALVDALPDGPDWFDHFPEYPTEEFHGIN